MKPHEIAAPKRMNSTERQHEFCLPPRPSTEILTDRLAAAVEAINAEQDPAERVRLHGEISRLRKALGLQGGAP